MARSIAAHRRPLNGHGLSGTIARDEHHRRQTMPIEFIGMIGVRPEGADGAAVHVIGGEIDPGWVRDFSRAHEHAGFDKVLVGYTATSAEGFMVSSYAARSEERRVGKECRSGGAV